MWGRPCGEVCAQGWNSSSRKDRAEQRARCRASSGGKKVVAAAARDEGRGGLAASRVFVCVYGSTVPFVSPRRKATYGGGPRGSREGGEIRDRIRKQLRALPPASVIGVRRGGCEQARASQRRPSAHAAGSFREEPPSRARATPLLLRQQLCPPAATAATTTERDLSPSLSFSATAEESPRQIDYRAPPQEIHTDAQKALALHAARPLSDRPVDSSRAGKKGRPSACVFVCVELYTHAFFGRGVDLYISLLKRPRERGWQRADREEEEESYVVRHCFAAEEEQPPSHFPTSVLRCVTCLLAVCFRRVCLWCSAGARTGPSGVGIPEEREEEASASSLASSFLPANVSREGVVKRLGEHFHFLVEVAVGGRHGMVRSRETGISPERTPMLGYIACFAFSWPLSLRQSLSWSANLFVLLLKDE
ncbi:hypothetical protein MTO96_000268 [Rhipicephalus appendiculatus]